LDRPRFHGRREIGIDPSARYMKPAQLRQLLYQRVG
jgi:hypothetical protein